MLDPDRQIRFLYPPLFLVGSLAWGFHLDQVQSLEAVFPGAALSGSLDRVLALAATGGVVLVASGFVISVISITVFRLWVTITRSKPYEAWLSDAALDLIHAHLKLAKPREGTDAIYLSATLDHEIISGPIHQWVLRRWSMFYVSSNSAMAVVLSLVVGHLLGVSVLWAWLIQAIVVALLLAVSARWAWLDTMGMLEFQALRLSSATATPTRPRMPLGGGASPISISEAVEQRVVE